MATISPPPRRPIGDGCNGPAPTYAHAVEAFLVAHDRAGEWSAATAVKYRQSLAILGTRLSDGPTGASVAALDTPDGASVLEVAFTAAFATLAPATRARHLAALRSALGWWRARGWLAGDPTAGWARPKIARDHSRALTPDQIAALWRLDVGLREKTLWRLLYETAARASEILTLDIPISTDPANAPAWCPKAGTPTGCTTKPGPPCCYPDSSPAGPGDRCSSPSGPPPARCPPWTCAPTPAGPDCPTAGLTNCSNTPPHPSPPPPDSRQDGPSTNYATLR